MVVQEGATVSHSVLMPGCVVEMGAIVQYAIVGEYARIGSGAIVGSEPTGADNWGITTCGPKSYVGSGETIRAGAMLYSAKEGK